MLRPYGEPSLLSMGFHSRTNVTGNNSNTFYEGQMGFLGLQNPYNITRNEVWTVSCNAISYPYS